MKQVSVKKPLHMDPCPEVWYYRYCYKNSLMRLILLNYHGGDCSRVHVFMYTDTVQLAQHCVLVRLTCTTWYVHYMYTDMDSVNHLHNEVSCL